MMIWMSKGFLLVATMCYAFFGWLGGCGLTPQFSPLSRSDQAMYSRSGEIRLGADPAQNTVIDNMHRRDVDTEQMRIATAYLLDQQNARNSFNVWMMHGFISLVLGFGWLFVFHMKTQKQLDTDRDRLRIGIDQSWLNEQREKFSQYHST